MEGGGGSFAVDDLNCPLNYYGGNVEVWNLNGAANVTWTSANDSISLKNFGTGGAVTFAQNKRFCDASGSAYSGTLTDEQKTALSSVESGITALHAINGFIVKLPEDVTLTETTGITKLGDNVYIVAENTQVTLALPEGKVQSGDTAPTSSATEDKGRQRR